MTTKKSKSKAAGVKSVLILDRDRASAAATAFGKGNTAILEKKIHVREIENVASPANFNLQPEPAQGLLGNRSARRAEKRERYFAAHPEAREAYARTHFEADAAAPAADVADKYAVRSYRPCAPNGVQRDNPLKSAPADRLHAKDLLETQVFGRTFSDTLHVQIAYAILDVNKIFTPHIANLVYVLNNLVRNGELAAKDPVGSLIWGVEEAMAERRARPSQTKWQDFLEWKRAAQPYFGYFGEAFPKLAREGAGGARGGHRPGAAPARRQAAIGDAQKAEINSRHDDEVWCVVSLVSALRAAVVHGHEPNYLFQPNRLHNAILSAVNQVYATRIAELNKSFIAHNGKSNLPILFDYYGAHDEAAQAALTREFYDFVVRKQAKNMGFSLRTIREEMLRCDDDGRRLASDEYSTIRHKLYSLLDFIVWKHFKTVTQGQTPEFIIAQLRAATEEKEQEKIYKRAAASAWHSLQDDVCKRLLPRINAIKEDKKGAALEAGVATRLENAIKGVQVTADGTSLFSQIVYFVSRFLDGKEINDLLTTLIHAFENIESFRDVERKLVEAGELTEVATFTPAYDLFGQSGDVATELRVVNSFARMSRETPDINRQQYVDAARVLGIKGKRDAEQTDEDYVSAMLKLSEKKTKEKAVDHSYRNFIAKNVVESTRFKYVVRYANPATLKRLATPEVVRFVLGRIWDNDQARLGEHAGQGCNQSIIARYTKRLGISETLPREAQIDALASRLDGITFETFMGARQNVRPGTPEADEKDRLLALVRLYLVALYHIVKNLVYINARYLIADHRLEFDSRLHGAGDFDRSGKMTGGYSQLTRRFIAERWLNPRACGYLANNLAPGKYSDWLFLAYRNAVAHFQVLAAAPAALEARHGERRGMGAIPSWFALYHYVMQTACIRETIETTMVEWDASKGAADENARNQQALGEAIRIFCAEGGPFDEVERTGAFGKDVLWSLNAPFGYNLSRCKNLSVAALFDRNEPPPDTSEATEAGG